MATRVYEYGLLPPDVNGALVFDQMRQAHRYYNRLTEIERARRAQVREVLGGHTDVAPLELGVKGLTEKRQAAREQIQAYRAQTKSRKAPVELTRAVKGISTALKAQRAGLKAAKQAIIADPQIAERLALCTSWGQDQVKAARDVCGVYWGTYLLIEQAMDAARKNKADPPFRRFTGDGRVSVQIQGGMAVDELFQDNTRVQIVTRETTDPNLDAQIAAKVAARHALRGRWKMDADRPALLQARALSKEIHVLRTQNVGYRRKSDRPSLHGHVIRTARLRLRVQSTDKGKPVWAEWPLLIDRPLPQGARIKVITVCKTRRDSASHEWRLQLTLDVGACQLGIPGTGACALNLGWWQKPDGSRRAGYVVGDDGAVQEITLPRSIVDRIEKSESIQGFRDQGRNGMQAALGAWIAANRDTLPPWFLAATEAFHAWKSPQRFAGLLGLWKQMRWDRETGAPQGGRWDGDAEGYALLEAWNHRDRHLEQYQSGLRRGALRHRRDIYRCAAKALSTRYHTLVIDNTDLREFQRNPAPEDRQDKVDAVARNQIYVAPYELRLTLMSAFTRAGAVAKHSAQDVTRRHASCGSIEDWDRSRGLREHTCGTCGETYDQDANACLNLLRMHAAEGAAPAADPAVKKESRSERLLKNRWKREKRDEGSVAP